MLLKRLIVLIVRAYKLGAGSNDVVSGSTPVLYTNCECGGDEIVVNGRVYREVETMFIAIIKNGVIVDINTTAIGDRWSANGATHLLGSWIYLVGHTHPEEDIPVPSIGDKRILSNHALPYGKISLLLGNRGLYLYNMYGTIEPVDIIPDSVQYRVPLSVIDKITNITSAIDVRVDSGESISSTPNKRLLRALDGLV